MLSKLKFAFRNGNNISKHVFICAQTGRCLKHKMNFGRPMWDKEFESIGDAHAGYVSRLKYISSIWMDDLFQVAVMQD